MNSAKDFAITFCAKFLQAFGLKGAQFLRGFGLRGSVLARFRFKGVTETSRFTDNENHSQVVEN